MNTTVPTGDQQEFTNWIIKCFRPSDSPADFAKAMDLRLEVFVNEQNVPEEEERDDADADALHCLILDPATGEPVATGRMVPYQEGCQMRPVAKIGRVAVKKTMRGCKLGNRVMEEIIKVSAAEGYAQAILDSQTHALAFYEKLGFVAEGEEFMDAGIPHYRMRLVLH